MELMIELFGLFAPILAMVTLATPLLKKSTDVEKMWVTCGQISQLSTVEGK